MLKIIIISFIYLQIYVGHYDWINNIIDSGSASHTEKWGCVWNKDIEGIVKEAGLRVKSSHRVHFGTTYIIEASPI
jgi:methyltransferase OMS1